jgi:hypothetical protein
MDKIAIEKTGNFWIDSGIVALYKILRKTGYSADLDASTLSVSSENNNGKNVKDILNHAKEEVVKHYLSQTKNFGWILKDGQFEIYRKTDFKMHLKPFFTGKTPNTEGAICTPDAKEKGKVQRMNDEEYRLFLSFKKNTTSNDGKKIKLDKKGFLNTSPKYEIGNSFSEDFLKEGNKLCDFSGKHYKKVDKINGMNYPFLTSMTGEINFASQLQLKPNISSLYSFVSLFSFYNLNFLMQLNEKGKLKDAHYFILYDNNLKDLERFYDVIVANINNLTKPDFCSFETQITGTQYESESFFNFLLSVYNQVNQRIDKDKRKGILLKKSVFTLSNDGNIFRDVKEYTSLNALFELFDCLEDNGTDEISYREPFLNFVRYFNKRLDSGKYDTTWRNCLCLDILSFRSILKTVEWFMGEVKMKEDKGSIIFLDKIIEIYNSKTQKKMNQEMVKICQSIGINIGIYAEKENDKSSLYLLRNSKSRTEFLKVLELIQFRILNSEKIPLEFKTKNYEDFFLMLDKDWEEYKSLVSIFSMNSFLIEKKKESEKQEH